MGMAITIVASGGLAVTEAPPGRGTPVEVVASGGIAATIVSSGGLPVVGAGEDYGIIIAGHQSNMTGGQMIATGATITADDDPSAFIWQYSPNGGTAAGDPVHTRVLEQAIEPLRYPSGVAIDANVGPALTYAKDVLASGRYRNVVIIPGGKGGTPLTDWVTGQPLFESIVTAYNQLIGELAALGKTYRLHSVIMSPLENEMNGGATPANTATRLDNTIASYRGLTGAANVPIYMGAAAPGYVATDAYRLILLEGAKVCTRTANVGVLGGYTGGSTPGDTVHYTNVANRARGHQLYALQSRTAVLQSPATAVSVISIDSQTITFTSTGAPYYTIHVGTPGQAVPYGDAGTDWVPNQDNTAGQVYTVTMPGSGDRDAYIVAHAYGGDSAPSPVVSYTAPVVVVPQALIQLDFSGEPNPMDAVPSVGTDTTNWNPTSSAGSDAAALIATTTQNSLTIAQIASANKNWKRAGFTLPAGSLTACFPLFMSNQGGTGALLAWGQASTNGDVYFGFANTCTNLKLGFTNTTTQLITTGAPLSGQNNKWHACAFTWDDVTKTPIIRLNGTVPAQSGTIINRSGSPSNSGGTKLYGYNADANSNGMAGCKVPTVGIWNSVLTNDQIDKWFNDIATLYGFTYG